MICRREARLTISSTNLKHSNEAETKEYASLPGRELLRVLKKGSNPQEEKSDLHEEKNEPTGRKNEPAGREKEPTGREKRTDT